MGAPKGNQFWRARSKHGRDKIFKTPEMLWDACCEYFDWIEANPLEADTVNFYQGKAIHEPIKKMRAMTITGLCLFLGVDDTTWREYRAQKDFSTIIMDVEKIIYNQKFQGASADLLNANIIARDLGLKDKQDIHHSGSIEDMSDDDLRAKILTLLSDIKDAD